MQFNPIFKIANTLWEMAQKQMNVHTMEWLGSNRNWYNPIWHWTESKQCLSMGKMNEMHKQCISQQVAWVGRLKNAFHVIHLRNKLMHPKRFLSNWLHDSQWQMNRNISIKWTRNRQHPIERIVTPKTSMSGYIFIMCLCRWVDFWTLFHYLLKAASCAFKVHLFSQYIFFNITPIGGNENEMANKYRANTASCWILNSE